MYIGYNTFTFKSIIHSKTSLVLGEYDAFNYCEYNIASTVLRSLVNKKHTDILK